MCQEKNQSSIAENGGACAAAAGIGKENLERCVASKGGELLKKSMKRAKELKVTTSCTVHVNNEAFCVHDGDWKHCALLSSFSITSYSCSNHFHK